MPRRCGLRGPPPRVGRRSPPRPSLVGASSRVAASSKKSKSRISSSCVLTRASVASQALYGMRPTCVSSGGGPSLAVTKDAGPCRRPRSPPDNESSSSIGTGRSDHSAAADPGRSGSRGTSGPVSTWRSRSSRARASARRARHARPRPQHGYATSAVFARTTSAATTGHVYIAYEYVPGRTLARRPAQRRRHRPPVRGSSRAGARRPRACARPRHRPPGREAVERAARGQPRPSRSSSSTSVSPSSTRQTRSRPWATCPGRSPTSRRSG